MHGIKRKTPEGGARSYKWLLGLAFTPIVVGAIAGFLDTKSMIVGAIVSQIKLCPEYETNPEQEALSNCVDRPRRHDKPVYNRPALCEKFKPHGSNGLDSNSNQENKQFAQLRCPLG